MIIRKNAKAIILKLKNPDIITTVIPSAKKFHYKGSELVAVPHRDDETKILRNLGFDVPAPIEMYYDWPGRYTPFEHQKATAGFLTMNSRGFCLNGLGSGKTSAVLWAFDYLKSIGKAKKLLVISPLSTLERTWGDEIFKSFVHMNYVSLHGSREKRLKLLDQDVDVYLINHDGVKVITKELAAQKFDIVVIDEISQAARNASTATWKALKTITENKAMLWGLTGTPTPNDPTDAWAQCRLVVPERVPKYFGKFRDTVMKQINMYKWVPRANSAQIVADAMQPSILFKTAECIDLPPIIYETREVELSAEQKHLYKTMLAQLHSEYEGGQITAVNEAVKVQKLVQIACGVAYGNDGKAVVIPAHSRLEETRQIIEDAAGKVIVFVPFTSALESVAAYLGKHYSVEMIHGQVGKGERDRIFGAFQHEQEPRVIVANARAMSHGLTLTAANTIVWFAPTNSNDTYEQANGRISRPGQARNQLIIHIEGSPAERAIYERLKTKGKMQGIVLSLLKDKS